MARSIKHQRELIENKLLVSELMKNANENVDAIAKTCGFSRQKAYRMIKQLEKNHVIWGYTAIVDVEAQGLQKFILSIKRSGKPLDKKSMNEIAYERLDTFIKNIGVVIDSSYYIHGEYDWILIILAKNVQQARKFADILLGAYPGIVDKVNLSQILYMQRDHSVPNPDQLKLMEFL